MRILAVDSGTTTTRVWALDDGAVLGTRSTRLGARDVARDSGRERLLKHIARLAGETFDEVGGDWETLDAVVAFGMITSELGLEEVPHLEAPVTPIDIAGRLERRDYAPDIPVPTYLVPGVRWNGNQGAGSTDFMRGEETEIAGLLDLDDAEPPLLYISPGSHTKFVTVDEGCKILWSYTTLSGELIWGLAQETILAGLLDPAWTGNDRTMVEHGADFARTYGLTRALYATRLMNRLDDVPPAACSAHVHGAVAGTDLDGLEALRDRLAVPLPSRVRVAADGGLGDAYLALLDNRAWTGSVSAITEPLGPAGAWRLFVHNRERYSPRIEPAGGTRS